VERVELRLRVDVECGGDASLDDDEELVPGAVVAARALELDVVVDLADARNRDDGRARLVLDERGDPPARVSDRDEIRGEAAPDVVEVGDG